MRLDHDDHGVRALEDGWKAKRVGPPDPLHPPTDPTRRRRRPRSDRYLPLRQLRPGQLSAGHRPKVRLDLAWSRLREINVLELDEQGEPVNEKHAERRAAAWLYRYCTGPPEEPDIEQPFSFDPHALHARNTNERLVNPALPDAHLGAMRCRKVGHASGLSPADIRKFRTNP
ncbi:DUF7677 family protein [Streptomyces canus]|uniref:DUF7677 family protein n=1 Tax=Streptomyces canus TaxID=58343 RepID=UPI003D9A367D